MPTYHILYIGATWCRSCKVIQPQIEALAARYGVPVRVADLDSLEDVDKEMISKVPTIVTFIDEKQSERIEKNHVATVTDWLQRTVPLTSSDF